MQTLKVTVTDENGTVLDSIDIENEFDADRIELSLKDEDSKDPYADDTLYLDR